MSVDPYIFPGTSVLKNKLNIIDDDTLAEVENDLTGSRIKELRGAPISGDLDFDHLKAIEALARANHLKYLGPDKFAEQPELIYPQPTFLHR